MGITELKDKLKTDKLPPQLRSRRALAGIVLILAALGGGYYYFTNAGPKPAFANATPRTLPRKTTASPRNATTRFTSKTSPAKPGASPSGASIAPTPAPLKIEATADTLGPVYVDEANGFDVRFPAGWALRTFNGDPWVLDCGDTRTGVISIGFSPTPSPNYRADRLLPETIARRIRRRPDTILHAQGRTQIDGHASIWSKSTGPLPTTTGAPRMTQVQYIVPLTDGRVLELRVAAPPDRFNDLAQLFSKSLTTFHLNQHDSSKPN